MRIVTSLLLGGAAIVGIYACGGGSPTSPSTSTASTTIASTTTVPGTTVPGTTVPGTTVSSTVATTTSSTIASTVSTSVSNMSALTWTITDSCSDGRGLHVRFWDKTNNLVWPNATQVYVVSPGATLNQTLSCQNGALVCFGARTDPQTTTYWGVDLDGNQGCDSCCIQCANVSTGANLTCS